MIYRLFIYGFLLVLWIRFAFRLYLEIKAYINSNKKR